MDRETGDGLAGVLGWLDRAAIVVLAGRSFAPTRPDCLPRFTRPEATDTTGGLSGKSQSRFAPK
jgi:hypothetical protein